jgi:hypothetical protein
MSTAAFKGGAKSKAVWVGVAIAALGYLQLNLALISDLLSPVLPPETTKQIMAALTLLLGLAVILIRIFTATSLHEKGGGG